MNTGKAWHLQGHYGRTADAMLKSGYIKKPKHIGGKQKDYYGNKMKDYYKKMDDRENLMSNERR